MFRLVVVLVLLYLTTLVSAQQNNVRLQALQPTSVYNGATASNHGSDFIAFAPSGYLDGSLSRFDVLLLGVGTAMAVTDYTDIASGISQLLPAVFVVFLDPNPGNPIKTSGNSYQKAVGSIQNWFASVARSVGDITFTKYVIGGHSASGRAAAQAISLGLAVSGFIGFDPYDYSTTQAGTYDIPVPALIWSLSKPSFLDTCRYDQSKSGYGFYVHATTTNPPNQCSTHRLYTFTDGTQHCVFANGGCPFVGCASQSTKQAAHAHVAQSIALYFAKPTQSWPQNGSQPFTNVVYHQRTACSD